MEGLNMTDKQKIAGLGFGLAVITAVGFGWNWFLKFNDCNQSRSDIVRLMDNQDDLLYTYGFFAEHSLTEDRQLSLRKLIETKEPLIKARVESFQKACRTASRKHELSGFLKGYELYLLTKQTLFKESQFSGIQWVREHFPFEPRLESMD